MKTRRMCPKCIRDRDSKGDGLRALSRGNSIEKPRSKRNRSEEKPSKSRSLVSGEVKPNIRVPLSRASKTLAKCKIDLFKDVGYVYKDKEDTTFYWRSGRRKGKKKKSRGKFKCESCPRVFASSQRLSVHKLCHRDKPKKESEENPDEEQRVDLSGDGHDVFWCPNCDKMFESDDQSDPETDQNIVNEIHAPLDFDLNLTPSDQEG